MRALVVIGVVLTACGRIDFADVTAAGDGRIADAVDAPDAVPPGFCASATFANPGASSIQDDFSVTPFTDRWRPVGPNCMTQGTNELVATPFDSGSYCHAYTMGDVHLTCDSIFVHVPQVSRQDLLGSQTFIYIYTPANDELLGVLLERNGLQISLTTTNIKAAESGGYSVTNDAWWRLREFDGELIFDTAPDGTSWQERMRAPTPWSLDRVEVAIGAGTYQPVTSPGQARFRCFNVPPPCN